MGSKKSPQTGNFLSAESMMPKASEEDDGQDLKPFGVSAFLCLAVAVYLCWTSSFPTPNIQFGVCLTSCIAASGERERERTKKKIKH